MPRYKNSYGSKHWKNASHKQNVHDPTTSYANGFDNDFYIIIERVSKKGSTGLAPVKFKAAITNYSENITANWNEELVYGKMDPIATYQNTQRTVSISWALIAMDLEEGKENLEKAARLQKFLYPAYETKNATSMKDSPLLRMSFLNFLKGASSGALMGYVSQFSYSPALEDGFLQEERRLGLIPKRIEMGCELKVLHEEELGWKTENGEYTWRGRKEFPFNVEDNDRELKPEEIAAEKAEAAEELAEYYRNAQRWKDADTERRLREYDELLASTPAPVKQSKFAKFFGKRKNE